MINKVADQTASLIGCMPSRFPQQIPEGRSRLDQNAVFGEFWGLTRNNWDAVLGILVERKRPLVPGKNGVARVDLWKFESVEAYLTSIYASYMCAPISNRVH